MPSTSRATGPIGTPPGADVSGVDSEDQGHLLAGASASVAAAFAAISSGNGANVAETALGLAKDAAPIAIVAQTLVSSFQYLRAVQAGKMSLSEAVGRIAEDAAIAGGAAALGAVIGGLVGGTGLPVSGVFIGMFVGALTAFAADRLAHYLIDAVHRALDGESERLEPPP